MLFHSFAYFVLFSVAFGVFWTIRTHEWRVAWLLLVSIIFYAAWNIWFVFLIAFTAGADYFFALKIQSAPSQRERRAWLLVSLTITLSLLIFFKYAGFLYQSTAGLLGLLGVHVSERVFHIALPLGISFYTFETISYVVDVYRGVLPAERNPLHYALYIMFFPHLISGPIVRPGKFLPQIRSTKHFDWVRMQLGVQLFLRGLLKKAVFADRLAPIVDPIFRGPGQYSPGALWLAAIGYAMQVYCDFSGYTDMALGSAHALGFKLPQNFNQPYLSASITEFWRRWHITLSSWVRDYIYIPLGGSRGATWKVYRNLLITMTALGLWHGAGWPCVVWGFYNGLILCFERAFPYPRWSEQGVARIGRVIWTMFLFCIGLVIFRNPTLASGGEMLLRMFQPLAGTTLSPAAVLTVLIIVSLILAGQLIGYFRLARAIAERVPAPVFGVALALLFLMIQLLIPENAQPFIYFQF